ncbi:TPA: contractile injection system protein, VgrG/Pvc8 family, partial [Pseudomonas sp. H2]|uniref:contractile injection system protein, VgrG/Pvc8 family n=1 Tax=Pseudomonas sp. H2 TaxID=658612 RepID=UPI003CF40578
MAIIRHSSTTSVATNLGLQSRHKGQVHHRGISTPFTLELTLISFENDIDFGHLLDKPVLFTIWEEGRPVRYVHGLVSRFSQAESGFYRTYYDALVEPQLARAGLRSNWRIFQQKTVPQILELMLQRQG